MHIRFQQALKHRLILKKVQRAIKFKLSIRLKPYIVWILNKELKQKMILRKISIISWTIQYLVK